MGTHRKYLGYMIRHKWFVFQAGLKMKVGLWRLLKHDWTKFLPSEWFPYAHNFYGKPFSGAAAYRRQFEQKRKDAYTQAWKLHLNRNDHHWQYWLLSNDDGSTECIEMPEAAWREMIADWMGAGRTITGKWDIEEWYEKNRDKIQLHPKTRAHVNSLFEP